MLPIGTMIEEARTKARAFKSSNFMHIGRGENMVVHCLAWLSMGWEQFMI